jgi:nucleoside-diphosphate-sugar epimerase
MIVAVTGASGFIGGHLTAELAARGFGVRALSRRPQPRDAAFVDAVDWVRVDYDDASALDRVFCDVSIVFHAAAATRAPTREELECANVELTRRVLSAMRLGGVGSARRRFVYVSSQAAAGPAAALETPSRECDDPRPIEAYGETKLAAERIVQEESDGDVTTTVIRPASVYGPRDRDFLQLFRLAHRGIALHPANRDKWISIIHVRDLVRGMIDAATNPLSSGRSYFLANDQPVQWSSLFQLGASVSGKQLSMDIELPRALVAIGARAGDIFARATGTATLLGSEKLALSRPSYWVCSTERAQRDLGFRASTSLADGFAETHSWYVEHGWL